MSKKSREYLEDPMFLRNQFPMVGKYDIPSMGKAYLHNRDIGFIPFSDVSKRTIHNVTRTVHCFQDDAKINVAYNSPNKKLFLLANFEHILTPDYSLYPEMPLCKQIDSVFRNRWCGAYWQECGLPVIPTISWSDNRSFEFCFDGVEKGSCVAVSTIGCKDYTRNFMAGYEQMLKKIEPSTIICYGQPIYGMQGDIIYVSYEETTRRNKSWVEEESMQENALAS